LITTSEKSGNIALDNAERRSVQWRDYTSYVCWTPINFGSFITYFG